MKEDLDFFFDNNVSQPKKKKLRDEENQAVQHKQNKITKSFDQHFLQQSERGWLVRHGLCFSRLHTDDKEDQSFLTRAKNFWWQNREMIHTFWEDCNELLFYKNICRPDSFMYLTGKTVIYPRVEKIVWNYNEEDEENFNKVKKGLVENTKIYQFVYFSAYPEVYSFVEKQFLELRNNFHLKFKDWKSIEGYFSKSESSSPPPTGGMQKNCWRMRTSKLEKIGWRAETEREGREKTKKERKKARNCDKKQRT